MSSALLPTRKLQHLSPKFVLSSSHMAKEVSALRCAVVLVQDSVSTSHGQPGLLAAGSYFALKSQAVQQGSNPRNLTVRFLLPQEERALWPGFQLQARGVLCLPGCLGARKVHKCAPSSCKNVGCSSLPVCANSLLSSSTQLLAYFQPVKRREGW